MQLTKRNESKIWQALLVKKSGSALHIQGGAIEDKSLQKMTKQFIRQFMKECDSILKINLLKT
jgi:hypothetical protein